MNYRLAILTSVLLGLYCSPAASAGPDLCVLLAPCEIPAAYSSGPFLAPPIVREVKLRQIQSICGGQRQNHAPSSSPNEILGCSQFKDKRCEVHVPIDVKSISPELFSMVLAHELAHCRGWVHPRF